MLFSSKEKKSLSSPLFPPRTRGSLVSIHSADAQANLKLNWNVGTDLRWHTASSPFPEAVCRLLTLQVVVLLYLRNNAHLLLKHCNSTIAITEASLFCVLNRSTVSKFETSSPQRDDDFYFYRHQPGNITYVETTLAQNLKAVPAVKILFSKS